MSLMNYDRNRRIDLLVAEYEAMSNRGFQSYLDEEAFHRLIDFYEQDEQFDRALEVVEHAISSYSFSSVFYVRKAQLLLDLGREEQALDSLDSAALFAPMDLETQLLRAEALSCLGMSEEAFDLLFSLREQVEPGEELCEVYFTEALVHEISSETEGAYLALKAAIRENPGHYPSLERIWFCIELLGKYEESLVFHEEILERDPYSFAAWYNLGQSQAYLGNYGEAIDAYEFAYLINEDFEPAYRERADLCFELKQYRRALLCYEDLLEQFEEDSELLLRIGQCYQFIGKTKTARHHFRKALTLDPFDDQLFFHLGQCYALDGKLTTAIRQFEKAIALEDTNEEYFTELALACRQAGSIEKAENNFRRALQLAPEDSRYWINLAAFLMEEKRGAEALDLVEEADLYATGSELIYCRTACLLLQGRRQEGLFWLGEALEEDTESSSLLFKLLPELQSDPEVAALMHTFRI
ncbi:MAG: tetratricopeptide repeat protein [Saprospiraceae bacterium]|nr:tetratricopeptide repeat protein [Saprospiraceae bacterium]